MLLSSIERWGGRMGRRLIFHMDVNSAFLSWEASYRMNHLGAAVDLREIPAAIGGDAGLRHGIILAKSIPAKKYGIQTGESIAEAKQKYPGLYLAPPNYSLYERCSNAFVKLASEYTPEIEKYSIDEIYMDMTEMQSLYRSPEKTAREIADRIREELGFTVNIGISENKLLAKMASDFQKPDRVHTLYIEEIPDKMWPLPVSELFFVGRATAKKLRNLGIHTIGELAETDPQLLRKHLKKQGEVIWAFANGIDCSEVQSVPIPNKGYGNSTTIAFDVADRETARMVLLALAETVGARLRKDGARISVVSVGVKDFRFYYCSHQMQLFNATNITNEIYHAACCLFDEIWDGTPIRHLGIHTSKVSRDAETCRQLNLFDGTDYCKWEEMDSTIDHIRAFHGNDAVKRAVFGAVENQKIDHMSGGISRERRSVDYSRLNIE